MLAAKCGAVHLRAKIENEEMTINIPDAHSHIQELVKKRI